MKKVSNENLINLFNEILIEEKNKYKNVEDLDDENFNRVIEIVVKINEIKKGVWTSISELINYNPKDFMIDPFTQGRTSKYVNLLCEKIGIKLIKENSFGGLAFMIKFKKK